MSGEMQLKRYQIFLSSTFADLEEERRKVMQTLLGMDCIPSGMEYFPASDEETFDFIKTVIDESDYYVLILAGRYGSVAADGVSYTEKEYDYALSSNKPLLSFVLKDTSQLTVAKTDKDHTLLRKMEAFRAKVLSSGRIAKFWSNGDELAAEVVMTLTHAIKRYPQPGWIRGDQAASADILNAVNTLRLENDRLKEQIQKTGTPKLPLENLAGLEDEFEIKFRAKINRSYDYRWLSTKITFGEILRKIGYRYRTPHTIKSLDDIKELLAERSSATSVELDYEYVRQIVTHLEILGILEPTIAQGVNSYVLTEVGVQEYLQRMAIRK